MSWDLAIAFAATAPADGRSCSAFMRSNQDEAWVTLRAPSASSSQDLGVFAQRRPRVRLVRQVSPNGAVRVLATNLKRDRRPVSRLRRAVSPTLAHRGSLQAPEAPDVPGIGLGPEPAGADHRRGGQDPQRQHCCVAVRRWPSQCEDLPSRERRCNRSYAAALLQRAPAQGCC